MPLGALKTLSSKAYDYGKIPIAQLNFCAKRDTYSPIDRWI